MAAQVIPIGRGIEGGEEGKVIFPVHPLTYESQSLSGGLRGDLLSSWQPVIAGEKFGPKDSTGWNIQSEQSVCSSLTPPRD